MNRRDIFKGAAGAVVAADAMRRQSQSGQSFAPPTAVDVYNLMSHNALPQVPADTFDPTHMIKSAMMETAQKEANRQEMLVIKAQQRLNRLRSTSDAWREAMHEKYQREKQVIWQRLDEARKFIFG